MFAELQRVGWGQRGVLVADNDVPQKGLTIMTFTLSWLTIITILAAVLALIDGIARVRSRGLASVLAILELLAAVLMLISIFFAFPAPLGTLLFAGILEVILILILLMGGTGRRGVRTITVIALILNSIVVLIALGWLTIPGLS